MSREPIRVLVTGAAGQFAYSFLYMVGRGDAFGPKQPIILILMDLATKQKQLSGVCMELTDCCFPLVTQIITTCEMATAFKNIDFAILAGSTPRKQGFQRRDLLRANVEIFRNQGQALNRYAKKTVRVLVISNPCNTCAYVCCKYAPTIPPQNFSALSRLDQNRTAAYLSDILQAPVNSIKNICVWGNHSPSACPDLTNAFFSSNDICKSVWESVNNPEKLNANVIKLVTGRGDKIIEMRQVSSAVSAARAACDHLRDWYCGTAKETFVSMSVMSDGSYGVTEDIMFSFPVEISGGKWKIVQGLELSDFVQNKINISSNELLAEKKAAADLLFKH